MIQKTIIDYLCNLININTTIDSNNEIEGILYIKEVFDNLGIENKIYEPVLGKGNIIVFSGICLFNDKFLTISIQIETNPLQSSAPLPTTQLFVMVALSGGKSQFSLL